MKKMKKLASLLLAMIMVFAMSMTAFADNTTNADLSGHTYKAYQIFTGTQATGSTALGQIVWGNGVNETALLAALKGTEGGIYASCETAADVAKVLGNYGTNSTGAKAFAKVVYNHIIGDGVAVQNGDTLPVGYYLIVDTTNVSGQDDVKNLALLELTGDGEVEIENKTSVPTVEKKVKDTNDTTGATTDWQDSADYDIKDEVPFQLKATLASNVTDYDTYKVVFHDTLSAGLDYKEGSAVVKMGDAVVTDKFEITESNGTLTISCDNVKAFGATNSSVIIVEYKAILDTDAVIGSVGNPNTVYLEYSNNPNNSQGGDNHPTGNTPTDKVIVFTYKVVADKYTKDNQGKEIALQGAGFTLYKKNTSGEYVAVGEEVKGDAMTQFVWSGLDDGDYKLEETTVPAGYNKAEDILFTIAATHDTESVDPKLTTLTAGELFTGVVNTGALSTKVENNKGATLPETGGMGTTLFYVAGFAMMITAAGAFVVRRRMSF